MPAPPSGVIMGFALSSFDSSVNPQTGPKLAKACGDVLGAAGKIFMDRVMMEPGVVCAVVPPAMVGTVAGVGHLIGPDLVDAEVKLEAEKAARDTGMTASDQKSFAETLTKMTVKGFKRFRELAQVLPGTPVAGGVTAAPGRITIGVSVIGAELGVMALGMNPPGPAAPPPAPPQRGGWGVQPQSSRGGLTMGGHRPGVTPPPPGPPKVALPQDFPQIAAKLVEKTLDQFASMAMVAPGIPVAGTVTVAPGRLL